MPITAFYNECDPFAAQWLRNLIQAGYLPAGIVDARDIREVKADEVRGYTQAHWFGGIGGWPLAFRLAGWPATRPVWTASLPCQPFSVAGKRKGEADERHLWPVFFRLVKECRPECILGEQVASADGYRWLDGIRHDLEAEGYAFGAADLPACSQGSPHKRQRLFWVARRLGESEVIGNGTMPDSGGYSQGQGAWRECGAGGSSSLGGVENPKGCGPQGGVSGERPGPPQSCGGPGEPAGTGVVPGFWDAFDIIHCLDGKARRVEPGIQCLVDGAAFRLASGRTRNDTSRAKLLKGIGNAIVAPVAAVFIRAFLESEADL